MKAPWPAYHDDWLVWIISPTGTVYEYMTECWSSHGRGTNWPATLAAARALAAAGQGSVLKFAVEVPGISSTEFFDSLNTWLSELEKSAPGLPDSAVYATHQTFIV